jgi:hypothetical protein
MIYGLNFNGTSIPDHLVKRFAKQISGRLRLHGVCTHKTEVDTMRMQTDNGRRQIKVVERHTKDGQIYGVYCL